MVSEQRGSQTNTPTKPSGPETDKSNENEPPANGGVSQNSSGKPQPAQTHGGDTEQKLNEIERSSLDALQDFDYLH